MENVIKMTWDRKWYEINDDIRTSNGYFRIERKFGRTTRLYCGDNMNTWMVLTGDPEQADIEDEIAEALNKQ